MTKLENVKSEADGKEWLKYLFTMIQAGMIDATYFTILIGKYRDHMTTIPREENKMLRYRQICEFQKKDADDLN